MCTAGVKKCLIKEIRSAGGHASSRGRAEHEAHEGFSETSGPLALLFLQEAHVHGLASSHE